MLRQVLLFCLLVAATTEVRSTIVAQLSGKWGSHRLYGSRHTEITDFRADRVAGFNHNWENGRLIVQSPGYYYIYAQAWFEPYYSRSGYRNRVAITVNGDTVSILQMTSDGSGYGSVFSGATKYLYRDDYISLKTLFPSKLWMASAHTFFGAYKID